MVGVRSVLGVLGVVVGLVGWADGEVRSGESQNNKQGFQYLAKFVYEMHPNNTGTQDTEMRFEVSLELDASEIPWEHKPKWRVLIYDDEEVQCEFNDNTCPKGCVLSKDGKTCSGVPEAIKGYESVVNAIENDNTRPYMVNGKKKDGPSQPLTCEQRIASANEQFMINFGEGGDSTYEFKERRRIFNHLRPRAFYAVLASENCEQAPLVEGVTWRIHWSNFGDRTWTSEFGYNEQGLVSTYLVFMFAYLLLCAAQIYSRTIYKYTHHLPRLFTASIASQTVATVFFTIHYLSFMLGGEENDESSGHPLCKFVGELATVFSKIVMVLMLLLIAQGWTILRGEVQYRQVIVTLILTMTGSSFALLLWNAFPASAATEVADGFGSWFLQDPASFTWLYITKPGIGLLIIDIAAAGIFVACCFWTVQRAEELRRRGQREFLMQIGIGFGAYLALIPITVDILALMDPWVMEFRVRTIQLCLTFAAHGTMLVLIWPTRAEKHFLEAGTFNKAPSGGFVSPFASGGVAGDGGLGETLLDESEDGYYGGF